MNSTAYKNQHSTMYSYKCRAECSADIDKVKKEMENHSVTFLTTKFEHATIPGLPFPLPDCEWVFSSPNTLDDIRVIVRTIPDSHVILQTLNLEQDYTGIRNRNLH